MFVHCPVVFFPIVPAVFEEYSYCKSPWEDRLFDCTCIGRISWPSLRFFSTQTFLPEKRVSLLAFCLGHVFRPPPLSPGPRSTHPAHRTFSSSNWFCQVEPKGNKELAVCLQCEVTPAHTSTVQPCTHRLTVRLRPRSLFTSKSKDQIMFFIKKLLF